MILLVISYCFEATDFLSNSLPFYITNFLCCVSCMFLHSEVFNQNMMIFCVVYPACFYSFCRFAIERYSISMGTLKKYSWSDFP